VAAGRQPDRDARASTRIPSETRQKTTCRNPNNRPSVFVKELAINLLTQTSEFENRSEDFLMKRLVLITGAMTALVLIALAVSAQKNTSFAGTWSLDKAKSQGLDQRMQNADITWTITQDDAKISIETKVSNAQAAAGGGLGGGGGMGGGRGMGMGGPRIYTLDGKEVTTEGGGQMGGSNTTKANWSSDGKTLELSSVRTGSFNGNDFKATSQDKLSLSGDGKTLTVVRHGESPRGTQDSTLVFNKQ
jgi:hypothetical protein